MAQGRPRKSTAERRLERSLLPSREALPQRSDTVPPTRRPPPPWRSPALRPLGIAIGTAAMMVITAGLAVTLAPALEESDDGLVPVLISVESNLPVKATVRHHRLERRSARDELTPLGRTPDLQRVPGAHVGDVVVLENEVQGAYHEHPIEFGQPGEVVTIRRNFQTGHVQFRLTRAAASGLGVFRNEHQIAPYVADVKIALVDGPHTLEIRGEALSRPVKVAVEVRAGEVTYVDPPRLVFADR